MTRLFYNYYTDPDPARNAELLRCRQKNTTCEGLTVVMLDGRPTFAEIIERVNEMQTGDDISILCNSDVYFEADGICLMRGMKPDEAYALGRWNVQADGTSVLEDRPDTQDAWVFRGRIRAFNANYTAGVRGADNRLAYEMVNAGYKVSNPCRTIKVHHLHLTGIRRYRHEIKFHVPPPYATPHPCVLV